MAPGRLFSTDDSSPENDRRRQEKSTGDKIGVGRSYECSFCKRGFTNAQALGGHMNIHRKDKAKAKQKINIQEESSLHNMKTNELYSKFRNIPNQIPNFDDHHHQFQLQQQLQLNYYMSIREQLNYKVYLPPSNPSTLQSGSNLHASRPDIHRDDHDHENLSLKIGLKPQVEVNDFGNERGNDEVDLELRLGHNPKW